MHWLVMLFGGAIGVDRLVAGPLGGVLRVDSLVVVAIWVEVIGDWFVFVVGCVGCISAVWWWW